VNAGSQNLLNAILGLILVATASWQIFFSFRPMKKNPNARDRSPLLSWLMLPVGAEVGFSSAGAGALGSAALLSLTPLEPAQVVGTDIAFGFVVSLIGSGAHWFSHASNPDLLTHLIEGGVAGAILGTIPRKGSIIRGMSTMPAAWGWSPAFAAKRATTLSARAWRCSSTSPIAARRAAIRRRATAREF
jgi:uncharacterized membrane protein YfcA